MLSLTVRTLAVAGLVAFSTNVAAEKVKYSGPTMDLSKYQPEFRVGFLGDESAQDIMTRNACLQDYVEAAYQVPAKMFTFKDYAGTMEAMLGGTLDYTWFGSSGYAGIYLQNPEAVVPVLTRMQPTGDTGYYSIMVARKDSGIKTLDDAKGKKLGFADPNSTSGYLIPSIELTEAPHSLDLKKDFSSTQFMGGHENGVLGVLNKDVDVAVTWVSGVGEWNEGYSSGNLRKMVDKGILNMDDLVQVWSSKLIPNGPVVMPKKLPEEARKVMVGMKQWIAKNDPECNENIANGVIKAWVPVDHSFYEVIVKARKAKLEAKKKTN
ncbi:MAG: phosphate/phosphite/phosphonate ABC transporter substrate-binding protein [Gammaproteobacteria bacterium]|nr:phosphate/phosphite/phosphonate ABC transporter substrate-binding protein [Gammaproteobacteria bacterium]